MYKFGNTKINTQDLM